MSGSARGGNDTLIGGEGNDHLIGDAYDMSDSTVGGNDTLTGGPGNDMLTGGPGADIFYFLNAFDHDTITDADYGDQLVFPNISNWSLSSSSGSSQDEAKTEISVADGGTVTLPGVGPSDFRWQYSGTDSIGELTFWITG